MIWALAAAALAAPVLGPPIDRLDRCAEAAVAEAGRPDGWDAPQPSDRIAVVVGVPCHRDPTIPSLAYSTRDATRIADWLEGAGFEVVRLSTVVDRDALDRALDAAGEALAPDGTLLVYFSGHGVLRDDGGRLQRYLVLSDTTFADVQATGLAVESLDRRLAAIEAAHRVVLQDTCFAASPTEGGKSLGLPAGIKGLPWIDPVPEPRPGDLHLYSSRFWEQAIEDPALRASVYTHHLLEGLSGPADLDADGCVGLKEAHAFARERVVDDRSGAQTPELRAGTPEDLALGCTGTPRRAVVEGPTEPRWRVAVEGGDARAAVGPIAVEPGRWRLVVDHVRDDGRVARLHGGPVRLEAGDWLDVLDRIDAARPYGILVAGGRFAPGAVLPTYAIATSAWWASRDRGSGRLALGGGLDLAPAGQLAAGCFRGTAARARAGWWLGRPSWAFGPVIGAGPVWRTPVGATCEAPSVHATGIGGSGELAGHGHIVVGRAAVGLDLGAEVTRVDRDAPGWAIAPVLRLGIGVSP